MPRTKNTPSVKPNVYSYDVGAEPFVHDKNRGKWSSIWDFYLVSVGHTFSINTLFLIPTIWIFHGGMAGIISTLIILMFYVIPILFAQSALGQFSSSGFISVFRIAPLFKGLGYIILILNLITASYYSVLAAYPLYIIFNSFAAELPWTTCNNTWNTDDCLLVDDAKNLSTYGITTAPTEFFRYNLLRFDQPIHTFSWPIIGCLLLVWTLVGFYNSQGIKSIEKAFRYGLLIGGVLFLVIFLRFAALPGNESSSNEYYNSFFSFNRFTSIAASPAMGVVFMGPGWGNAITIASFNKFKANVVRYSYVIPLLVLGVIILSSLFIIFALSYAKSDISVILNNYDYSTMGLPYYLIPTIIATLEVPQMWSIIFYSILFIFQSNILALQVFGICTSLLDEFEKLRKFRRVYSIAVCVILFFASIVYSTGLGIGVYSIFVKWECISQMAICFLQLMIVVWVYGRIRFQRDIKFMTGFRFSNLQFFILRFITPIVTIVAVVSSLAFYFPIFYYYFAPNLMVAVIFLFFVTPWILVPGYAIYKLYIATGTFCNRLRKSVRPHDWYPSEGDDRQRYEEEQNSAVITHQLVEESPENC